MLKKTQDINLKKIIGLFLFFTLIISIVYIIIRIIIAPTEVDTAHNQHIKVKGDYVLTLLQCLLGIIVMMIPQFIEKRKSIDIPDFIEILYFIFLYCAIYLGEVRHFYYLIPFWDTILHAFSGLMLGAVGFILVSFLNEVEHVKMDLSPLFVAFFAFCFGLTSGAIWEIYEFMADGVLGLNMQKFALSDGTKLIGRDALADTMWDLVVDAVCVGTISVLGYTKLKIAKKRIYIRK